MKYDFSGYATKHNIRCSDGLIINSEAFKDCDGARVPLVFQHNHRSVDQVLGFVDLEHTTEGVKAYGSFNNTPSGQSAKSMVEHGDIEYMSIFANGVQKNGTNVVHGNIREVSLVLAGANPGARIETLTIVHDDFEEEVEDEAIIYSGVKIQSGEEVVRHEDSSGETLRDIYDTLTQKQKDAVCAIVAMALDVDEVSQSDTDDDEEEGGDEMSHNIFEGEKSQQGSTTITHDQMVAIFDDARKNGSLKDAVISHAQTYGITNIDLLFPDATSINGKTPEFIKRKTEWVSGVLNGCRHSPFSRIKMMYADITADEARAKGYIKGNMKKEEFFSLSKREISPTTIYKKQKLDRDDIVDITDFSFVSWIKAEMRVMLDEEIARAVLIGDGREVDDPDHIDETKLIPIIKEAELYAIKKELSAGKTPDEELDEMIRLMEDYEGTGTPNLYLPRGNLINYRLIKDKNGRRIYGSDSEIANLIGVNSLIEVPVMKGVKVDEKELVGIIVNLADYTIGADSGGQISFFDDFDIDYNQYKYLYETRISGCLTKMKSAIVITRAAGGRPTAS